MMLLFSLIKEMLSIFLTVSYLLLFTTGFTPVYEEVDVEHSAILSGTVTLSGPAPPPRRYRVNMGAYPEYCKVIADKNGNIEVAEVRTTNEGFFADVVVFLQEVERGKSRASIGPTLRIDQCQFHPFVTAGAYGQTLQIHMDDAVLHPIRGWEMLTEGRVPLFDFPDLKQGDRKVAELSTKVSSIVKIECDQHRFMQSWILVPANPYFAVTDTTGRFEITDIPAGTHTLGAWHPILGYQETRVTLSPDHHTKVRVTMGTRTNRKP